MTKPPLIGLIALALLSPAIAHSLEPSTSVTTRTVLKTTSSWNGTPIRYPDGQAEVTGILVEIAPGGETGWHLHPVPSFGMVLEGVLEVRLKDGAIKRLNPGDALAEVVDTAHNGRNAGSVPVKLIVFYAGAVDRPLSIKDKAEKPVEMP